MCRCVAWTGIAWMSDGRRGTVKGRKGRRMMPTNRANLLICDLASSISTLLMTEIV